MVYGLLHLQIKMREKLTGVHTGIRPAAADSFYRLAQNGGQRFVQHFLHGNGVGLHLPAVIVGAIVKKFNKKALGCHCGQIYELAVLFYRIQIYSLPQRVQLTVRKGRRSLSAMQGFAKPLPILQGKESLKSLLLLSFPQL